MTSDPSSELHDNFLRADYRWSELKIWDTKDTAHQILSKVLLVTQNAPIEHVSLAIQAPVGRAFRAHVFTKHLIIQIFSDVDDADPSFVVFPRKTLRQITLHSAPITSKQVWNQENNLLMELNYEFGTVVLTSAGLSSATSRDSLSALVPRLFDDLASAGSTSN
jgi:hypothetical protein